MVLLCTYFKNILTITNAHKKRVLSNIKRTKRESFALSEQCQFVDVIDRIQNYSSSVKRVDIIIKVKS